jgi:hypothetical protein
MFGLLKQPAWLSSEPLIKWTIAVRTEQINQFNYSIGSLYVSQKPDDQCFLPLLSAPLSACLAAYFVRIRT